MAEDKDEGEVQETSEYSSVEEEGSFSSGSDNQISTIEDELKRAQATLFDLQNLKLKLEAERRINSHKANQEKELQEAEIIKKENDRLRTELREYHSEVGSLKDIIGSLKDDLVKTAERLEHKVNKSIHSLEDLDHLDHKDKKPSTEHPHHATHVHHVKKAPEERNFFSDHLNPQPVVSEAEIHHEEPKLAEVVEAPPAPTQVNTPVAPAPENAPQTATAPPQAVTESPSPAPAPESAAPTPAATPESAPVVAPVAPTVASAPNPAIPESSKSNLIDNFLNEDTKADSSVSAVVTKIETNQAINDQNAEDLMDEDFDEYEQIKKELEELEGESLFKSTIAEEIHEEKAEGEEAAKVPKPEAEKAKMAGLLSLFKKRKKAPKGEIKTNEPAPAVIIGEPLKDEPNLTVSAEAVPAKAPEAPANNNITENVENKETAPTIAEEHKEEEKNIKESSAINSLKNIFKKKKPKARGNLDDHEKGKPTGVGRVALGAAVVILIAAAGVLTYKIRNAEALRTMYTSKATESVIEGSKNSNQAEVPDQFSKSDPQVKYKEAFVDAPFADTVWLNYQDPDIGISIDYPQNTSYRLKPVGSGNIWFLRKDGYLLKIEKITTNQSLGEFADSISLDIKYTRESLVVRGRSTLHLILDEDLPVNGNIYLTQGAGAIYKIWYKTFSPGENTDDEQRVKKMLDTLDFISNSSS